MFSNMTFYTVCLFLAILVSVVFFGYNLSMLLNTYSSFCSKALKYRDLLKLKELVNFNIGNRNQKCLKLNKVL